MERSRLPLPSLLGLCSALLMLFPELLMGQTSKFIELPATNPEAQAVLAFAVLQYNKRTGANSNYFKVLRLVKVVKEVFIVSPYYLMVELVEASCQKKPGMKITYKNIEKCPLLPGNQKKRICFFKLIQIPKFKYMVLLELVVILCI